MNLLDVSPPPRGIFTLNVFWRGLLDDQFTDDNLIVNRGRTNVSRLVGGDVAGLSVTKIGYGTNGTPAAHGNTVLASPYVKALDGKTYPDDYSVLFNFSLGANEANGMQIKEFGLLTASGLLHARKVRGGVLVKDSDLSLTGTWQLIY